MTKTPNPSHIRQSHPHHLFTALRNAHVQPHPQCMRHLSTATNPSTFSLLLHLALLEPILKRESNERQVTIPLCFYQPPTRPLFCAHRKPHALPQNSAFCTCVCCPGGMHCVRTTCGGVDGTRRASASRSSPFSKQTDSRPFSKQRQPLFSLLLMLCLFFASSFARRPLCAQVLMRTRCVLRAVYIARWRGQPCFDCVGDCVLQPLAPLAAQSSHRGHSAPNLGRGAPDAVGARPPPPNLRFESFCARFHDDGFDFNDSIDSPANPDCCNTLALHCFVWARP